MLQSMGHIESETTEQLNLTEHEGYSSYERFG